MRANYLLFWLILFFGYSQRTTAQESLVKDIKPGTESSNPLRRVGAMLNNRLVFAADDGVNGNELWISDGTAAGTTLLRDIVPGGPTASSNPFHFFNLRGFVYFYIQISGTSKTELWRTDGAANGTIKVGDDETWIGNSDELEPWKRHFIESDTAIYFITLKGLINKDPDKPGFRTILSSATSPNLRGFPTEPQALKRFGNNWLFAAPADPESAQSLLLSDGTSAGTRRIVALKEVRVAERELCVTRDQKQAFFVDGDAATGTELWVTDGTTAGTRMVKNIAPGGSSSMDIRRPNAMRPLRNGVLFVANDGVNGQELWISDGTEAGTKLFREFTPGAQGSFPNFIDYRDELVYFAVRNQLWRSDGTEAGTYQLSTGSGLLSSWDRSSRKVGNDIYYLDGSGTFFLRRLNGQPNNDQLLIQLKNINVPTNAGFVVADKTIYYGGNSTTTGTELWKANFCDHTASITTPSGTTFCTGSSIDLEASGLGAAGPLTYRWASGTDNLGTNPKLTVNKGGTYTVEVTDSRGCSVSATTQVTESRNLPLLVTARDSDGRTTLVNGNSIQVNQLPDLCPDASLVLSSTFVGGTAPYSYRWRHWPTGATATGAAFASITVVERGTYLLTVTDSKGCTATSGELFIGRSSVPAVTIGTSGSTVVPPGTSLSVVLTALNSGGAGIQWFRNGQALTNNSTFNGTFLATQPGDYTLRAESNNCATTTSVTRLAVGLSLTVTGTPRFCPFNATSLTVTTTNGVGPFTYQWRLGNTTVSTSSTASISTAGTYSITVTDSRGVTGTIASLSVVPVPVPVLPAITPISSLTIQPGGSVLLTLPTAMYESVEWYRDEAVVQRGRLDFHLATLAGNYFARFRFNGCEGSSFRVDVVSLSTLRASISGSSQICGGQSTTLVASNTNGQAPFTYQWQLDGRTLATTSNTLVTSAQGTYGVTVTDSRGDVAASAAFVVAVKPSPDATVRVGGQLPLQPGGSAVLSVSAVAGQTYQWFQNGAALSGATSPTLTVSQAGTYTVGINRDGCVATSTPTVVQVQARLSAAIQVNSNIFCEGQNSVLMATVSGGQPPYSYQWRRDGGAVGGNTASLTITAGGNYSFIATDSQNSVVTSPVIIVTQRPSPNASVTVSGSTALTSGASAVLSVSAVAGQTYQWQRDGQPIAGATASSFTAIQAGSYAVTVTRDGCSATSVATVVSIILATEPIVPGFVLEVSPNPASTWLHVRLTLNAPATATLRLFDAAGRQVRMQTFGTAQRTHEHTFNVGDLPGGPLFLRAEAGDKQLTRKLIKE